MTFSSTSFHSLIKYVVKRPISGYILVILLAVHVMVTFIAVHKYCTSYLVEYFFETVQE
jgi:hypothetical protein